MCCEATDALLEFVRRFLGMTGLRNLNAPRRLKLRVPVLKEWLQRQGQGALASTIPDWDPVRRPTGKWKSWEMANLKPIMDEKAVERQAKRALVGGETTKDQLKKEQQQEATRNEVAGLLVGMCDNNDEGDEGEEGGYDGGYGEDRGVMALVDDDVAGGEQEEGKVEEGEMEDEELADAAAGARRQSSYLHPTRAHARHSRCSLSARICAHFPQRRPLSFPPSAGVTHYSRTLQEMRDLLGRYEASTDAQRAAIAAVRLAADELTRTLGANTLALSTCLLGPPRNGSTALAAPKYKGGLPPRSAALGDVKLEVVEDHSQGSQAEQALLELAGASQISLTGSLMGNCFASSQEVSNSQELSNSQEEEEEEEEADLDVPPVRSDGSDGSRDSTSPQQADPPAAMDGAAPRSAGETATRQQETAATDADPRMEPGQVLAGGLEPARKSSRKAVPPPFHDEEPRKRAKPSPQPAARVGAPHAAAVWPPVQVALAFEEPMGSQEQVSALELLGSQVSAMGSQAVA